VDADRQVEKMMSEEQKKALIEKLRMHEDLKTDLGPAQVIPDPEPKPQFFPPPKKKVTSI
jgi:hypothetical protein